MKENTTNIETVLKERENKPKLRMTFSTHTQGQLDVEFDEEDVYKIYGISFNELMKTEKLRIKFIAAVIKQAQKVTDLTFDSEDDLSVSFLNVSPSRYCLKIEKERQQYLVFNTKAKEFQKVMDSASINWNLL